MNPIYPTQLKALDDQLFGTKNLVTNLAIYSIVGAVGTVIGLATVLLPTPILYVSLCIRLTHSLTHLLGRELLCCPLSRASSNSRTHCA